MLFSLFLILSLSLTLLGGRERSNQAILNRLKLQSVNPDALPGRNPAAPGQATPPPVQGLPLSGAAAPKPSVRLPSAAPADTPTATGNFSTPAPAISLPPLPSASKPAKP